LLSPENNINGQIPFVIAAAAMLKRLLYILLIFWLLCTRGLGQETVYGPGYQFMVMNNPAFSGSEGSGTLRLTYLNFYPGNHYGLHSFYASYDSYFSGLHGGAGIWLADDYIGGIVNDFRGGLSYAYFLHAGKDMFINAGLSASVYHRGYDLTNVILPDQIDPLGGVTIPSSEALSANNRTVFDIDAGFLFIYKKFFGGFSVNHLSQPYLSYRGEYVDRLLRKVSMQAAYNIGIGSDAELMLRPVAFAEFQGRSSSYGGGAVIQSNTLSFSLLALADNAGKLNMQTGFSLKAGVVTLFYSYRFNIRQPGSIVPFSLQHQTGLAFSLNNVDKRKTTGTISFPKM
jgi:type IX secretion system PorP/SprF family membrane protein